MCRKSLKASPVFLATSTTVHDTPRGLAWIPPDCRVRSPGCGAMWPHPDALILEPSPSRLAIAHTVAPPPHICPTNEQGRVVRRWFPIYTDPSNIPPKSSGSQMFSGQFCPTIPPYTLDHSHKRYPSRKGGIRYSST